HPAATAADIEYILGHVNSVLTTPIGREDVRGVYAGLRPLLSGGADSTAKLSREHAVMIVAPGAVVVAGGKYTTYRVMAADAVDAAVAELGEAADRSEEHTSELQSRFDLVCRLLLEKKKNEYMRGPAY